MRDKGCRAGPGVKADPHVEAGKWNDLAMLTCLEQLGVPWHRGVREKAVYGDCELSVLQWMVQQRVPAGQGGMHSAVKEARRSFRGKQIKELRDRTRRRSTKSCRREEGSEGAAVAGGRVLLWWIAGREVARG